MREGYGGAAAFPQIALIEHPHHHVDVPSQVAKDGSGVLRRVLEGDHLQRNAGAQRFDAGAQRHERVGRRHVGHADANCQVLGIRGAGLGAANGVLGIAHHVARVLQQRFPGLGEHEPVAAAVEQGNTQPCFQRVDLLDDGRGRDVKR